MGIRTPLDALKSFALGAAAVGIAAPVLRLSEGQSATKAVNWLEGYLQGLKKGLLMLGCKTPHELRRHPLIITGYAAQWLAARGISPVKYGCRRGGENDDRGIDFGYKA